MQVYSEQTRENEDHALPDVEVFWADNELLSTFKDKSEWSDDERDNPDGEPGWYWWSCFPGCMPDSDPIGPFATEEEAINDARGDN